MTFTGIYLIPTSRCDYLKVMTFEKTDCNNYRGILLLPTTYKILSNILLSRLVPYAKRNYWGSSMWLSTQ